MWKDPIVKETRNLRMLYASILKNDADAIFKDILKRQEESKRVIIKFDARRPQLDKHVA